MGGCKGNLKSHGRLTLHPDLPPLFFHPSVSILTVPGLYGAHLSSLSLFLHTVRHGPLVPSRPVPSHPVRLSVRLSAPRNGEKIAESPKEKRSRFSTPLIKNSVAIFLFLYERLPRGLSFARSSSPIGSARRDNFQINLIYFFRYV